MSVNEPYAAARYMAVLSVVDYQDQATAEDIDFFAHAETSLEPEAESLENLGILQKNQDNQYEPDPSHTDMIEEIGEVVQIEYNGLWQKIDLDKEEIDRLADERTDKIHWIT